MVPFLEIKNLQHIYSAGTPFEHVALEDVSFGVERGEFIGVIGHTGSGKSTLIKLFNGLEKPTEGRVYVDGEDIWQNPKNIKITSFISKRFFHRLVHIPMHTAATTPASTR